MDFDPTHRTECFALPGNPKVFAHLCGPDPRLVPGSVLVVLVHGFPELGYSWRYQWRSLSELGYSVVSPDMRGYGQSWCPPNVQDYSFEQATLDLKNLVLALGRKQAVFVGHDFGGSVVWSMGLHRPEACLGVVGINTPLLLQPRDLPCGPMELMRSTMDSEQCGHMDYQVYFQRQDGVPDQELNANVGRTLRAYFRSQVSGDRQADRANMKLGMRTNKCRLTGVLASCPSEIPRDPLWTEQEMDEYVRNFERTGFPLNWYRAWDLNWLWDKTELPVDPKIDQPCLMVAAEYDAVLRPEHAHEMQQYFTQKLEVKQVSCGHWTMIEHKHELNAILVDFLGRRFPNGKTSKM